MFCQYNAPIIQSTELYTYYYPLLVHIITDCKADI